MKKSIPFFYITVCIFFIYGCIGFGNKTSIPNVWEPDSLLFIKNIVGPDGKYLDTTILACVLRPNGGLTFIAELEPYTFEICADTLWAVTYPLWCDGFVLQDDFTATGISNGDTLSGNALLMLMPKRDGLVSAGPMATDRDPNRGVTKDGRSKENQLILSYGNNQKIVIPLHVYMPLGMVYVAGERTKDELFNVANQDDWLTAVIQGFSRTEPVKVPENFYMSKFTITQAQWETVMGDNPSDIPYSDYEDHMKRPVNQISWHEVVGGHIIPAKDAFLAKINEEASPYKQINKEYRLPTTIEWEYAARGGIYRKSVTGGTDCQYAGFEPGVNTAITDYMWCAYNSSGTPREVGLKIGNELGLYDMSGNIWEWTHTKFGSFQIIRGGCWYDTGYECRVSFWDDGIPTGSFSNVGFRVAF